MGKRAINRFSMEDLPDDVVIHYILSRFDFPTWLRAAAVSHPWRRLALLAGPPIDVPWLWNAQTPPLDVVHHTTIPTPPAYVSSRCIGCLGSHILDGGRYTLPEGSGWDLNPGIRNPFSGKLSFPLPVLHQPKFEKVNLGRISSDPASNGQRCIIALATDTTVSLCRYGSGNWVAVNLPGVSDIHDLAFHKDTLYCVDGEGRVTGFTPEVFLSQDTLTVKNYIRQPWWKGTEHYLVEYCGGLLLVIGVYIRSTLHFLVQQLDEQAGKFVDVGDLGCLMLFVGKVSSIVGFINRNYPSENRFFTKNCIYFADLVGTRYDQVRIGKYDRSKAKLSYKFFGCPPRPFMNYCQPTWSWMNKPLSKLT